MSGTAGTTARWLARAYPLHALVLALGATMTATVVAATRWSSPEHRLAALFSGAYLAWLLVEARITVRSSGEEARSTDRGTTPLYALARVALIVVALFVPNHWPGYEPWMPALLVLFLAGVGLRLWAVRTLGRHYSHKVRTITGHRIVREGPYRFVRHPAYAGMLLAHLAFVLFFLSNASVAVLVVLFAPAIVLRILVEEAVLRDIPGYIAYASGVRRLVPYVW